MLNLPVHGPARRDPRILRAAPGSRQVAPLGKNRLTATAGQRPREDIPTASVRRDHAEDLAVHQLG
jgi:hypothetical protein